MSSIKELHELFLRILLPPGGATDAGKTAIFLEPYERIFRYIWDHEFTKKIVITNGNRDINRKGSAESEAFRNQGNRLYKAKKFDKALMAYNYALLAAAHPEDDIHNAEDVSSECFDVPYSPPYSADQYPHLAFAFANRSALLLEMEQHGSAVNDIHYALKYGYTHSKQYKLFERKIKCLIGLREFNDAKALSVSLLKNVHLFDMDAKELSQLKSNIVKLVLKCDKYTEKMQTTIPSPYSDTDSLKYNSMGSISDKTFSKDGDATKYSKLFYRGQDFPPRSIQESRDGLGLVSTAITVASSATKGRYLEAVRDIEPGEVLMVEESAASCPLLGASLRTHCAHCLRRAPIPLPCSRCSLVVFCDSRCRASSLKLGWGHASECQLLPSLVTLQPDLDALLTLRLMNALGKDTIRRYMQKLGQKPISEVKPDDLQKLLDVSENNHEFLYNLEGNHTRRSVNEKIEAGVTAVILTKLLLKFPLFWNLPAGCSEASSVSPEDITLVGSHVMRMLFNIQCNAHCIKELRITGESSNRGTHRDVGYSLHQKLSLVNHSCAANTHQSSCGRKKVLYAVTRILSGEEITMSYGERFVSHPKQARQKALREAYFFDCNCIACAKDWSLFEELPAKFYIRCSKCGSNVDPTSYKCTKCQLLHRSTSSNKKNVKKGKKSSKQGPPQSAYDAPSCQSELSKAWHVYNEAYVNIDKFQTNDADREKAETLIALMDKYAQLPNKPYIEAQETIMRWFDMKSAASFSLELP